jgi:hypothetical protein
LRPETPLECFIDNRDRRGGFVVCFREEASVLERDAQRLEVVGGNGAAIGFDKRKAAEVFQALSRIR